MKTFLALVVLVLIGLGAYLYFQPATVSESAPETANTDSSDTTSMMQAEPSAVYVPEQRPGETVRGGVVLAAAGYLVIHEDADGEAGAVIGSSALLPAGNTADVEVRLSRPSRNGEVLHAMLHFEKDGNATFTASEDTPVPSTLGGPISGWFHIADDAPVETPITL